MLESMVKNAFVLETAGGISHTTETIGILSAISEERTKRGRILSGFYAPFGRNLESQLSSYEGISGIKRHGEKEIIEIHTIGGLSEDESIPGQEYHLKADINLTGTEGERGVIPEFTGVAGWTAL